MHIFFGFHFLNTRKSKITSFIKICTALTTLSQTRHSNSGSHSHILCNFLELLKLQTSFHLACCRIIAHLKTAHRVGVSLTAGHSPRASGTNFCTCACVWAQRISWSLAKKISAVAFICVGFLSILRTAVCTCTCKF